MSSALLLLAVALMSPPLLADNMRPKNLLIFYGFPGLINGANNNIAVAASHFAPYQFVVLGNGLQEGPGDPNPHPNHQQTRQVIQHPVVAGTLFFGYIPLGALPQSPNLSLAEIDRRAQRWAAMGVDGVLLDEFGYDYGVSRDRQNAAVASVQSRGLRVIANAFRPDDAFSDAVSASNPSGTPTRLNRGDFYLYESHQIIRGIREDPVSWLAKSDAIALHQGRLGFRVLSVTTPDENTGSFSQLLWNYAWHSAALFDHAATGWGELFYSAPSSMAPLRQRPSADPRAFRTPLGIDGDRYARKTCSSEIWINADSGTSGSLAIAPCTDLAYQCTTAPNAIVPFSGAMDSEIDSNGRMVFVSWTPSSTTGPVRISFCQDADCASVTPRELATGVSLQSTDLDLVLRDDGSPVVTYANQGAGGGIRLVLCGDAACSSHVTRSITSGSFPLSNIHPVAALSNQRPLVAFFNNRLELYRCDNADCTAGNLRTADASAGAGFYGSIAVNSLGALLISHVANAAPNLVRLYECADAICTTGVSRLNLPAPESLYSQLALRKQTLPTVAFSEFNSSGPDRFTIYSCSTADCSQGSRAPDFVAPGKIRVTDLALIRNELAFATFASDADGKIYYFQCHDPLCITRSTAPAASFGTDITHTLSVAPNGTAIILHSNASGSGQAMTTCRAPSDVVFRDGFEDA